MLHSAWPATHRRDTMGPGFSIAGRWVGVLILLLALGGHWVVPEAEAQEGTLLETVPGQNLTSFPYPIAFGPEVPDPAVTMKLGFASDEVWAPGVFFDAFTVTLRTDDGSATWILGTLDINGVVWAPATPGTEFLDPMAIERAAIGFPDLSPGLAFALAFDVRVTLPTEVAGRSSTLFFDLASNDNGVASQGWFSEVTLVPEPSPALLALLGGGWLFLRRGQSGRAASAAVKAVSRSRGRGLKGGCLALVLGGGLMLPGAAEAQETRNFQLQQVSVTLTDVSADADVRFSSLRWNRALEVWNVEVSVSNKTASALSGPLVVWVESFRGTSGPQGVDGTTGTGQGFYDVSGQMAETALAPGQVTAPRTLTLGRGNTGSPSLTTRVYAARPPRTATLAVTRSLDDAGRPLPRVSLAFSGPEGPGTQTTDPDSGVVSFGQGAGPHTVRFSREGYLPVWRQETLVADQTTVLANPRLTPRAERSVPVTPLGGAVIEDGSGSVRIEVGPGVMTQETALTLTPLTSQNLPALVPRGWSPLRAFWLESPTAFLSPPNAWLRPEGPIESAETAALVQWDEARLEWRVAQVVSGQGTNAVSVALPSPGAYALVVADTGELAPPPAQVGEVLPASSPVEVLLAGMTAIGEVTPSSSAASRIASEVTGLARVTLEHSGQALPSGMLLRGEVTETYRLSDGSLRLTPQYEHFIIGYQRPGDQNPNTLQASFPMRPMLLFGPEELEEATVRVEVLAELPFDGQVLDESGGQVARDGVRLLAGTGRLTGPSAFRLRRLDEQVFLGLADAGHTVLGAFDLTVDRSTVLEPLATQLNGVPPNSLLVLARILSDTGFYGLQPVERLQSDAQGNLRSLEPVEGEGERLPGLRGSGQFVLLQVTQPQGLISGLSRNGSNQVQEGMPVRILGLPWLTLTDDQGRYQLIAPAGEREVVATDPLTGDTGVAEVSVPAPLTAITQDLAATASGPRVLRLSPADQAVRVPRVGSVIIEFNEALNPATVPGAIQLLKPDDSPVSAVLSLNLRNTIATLNAATDLEPNTTYRVRLADTLADPGGLPLEGRREFQFTTAALSARDPAAQLIIYEPGATNVPPAILDQIPAYTPGQDPFAIVVRGTPGVADPEVAVILVNESTGETATVLSRPDGSFASVISGTEEDFVSATFINLNGTRVYVPVSRQEFDDGFVGLYPQGGILEAVSDGGPVQVIIEPQAIPNRGKFRLRTPTAAQLAELLGDTEPEAGTTLARPMILEGETQPLAGPMHVEFKVNLAAAGYPTNLDPLEAAIALVNVTDTDGIKAFEVLDRMQFTPNASAAPARAALQRVPVAGAQTASTGEQLYFGVVNSTIGLIPQAGIANNVFRYVLMPILVGGHPIVVKGRVIQSVELPTVANPFKINNPVFQGFKFSMLGSAFKPLDIASSAIGQGNSAGGTAADLLLGSPLGGAFITLQNIGTPGIPGRIRPGMVYATSDRQGNFLMVAPTTPFVEIRPEDFFLVMATHPRFREKLSEKLFALQDLSIAGVAFKNFVFREPLPVQVPPQVNIAHAPPYAAAGQAVELQVNAAQGFLGNPEVNVFVEQVVPESLPLSSVTLSNIVVTTEGNRTRWSAEVQPTEAVRRTVLRVSVIASGGQVRVLRYPISFTGAPEPDPTTPIPPSDPDETKGPAVTVSLPVEDAVLSQSGTITLTFNEPIDRSVLTETGGLILSPDLGVAPAVRLSSDQTVLTLTYAGLQPDTEYTLTVSGESVRDLNGNALDQRPSTEVPDAFTLSFRTPPLVHAELPGMINGAGSAIHGARLYALDNAAIPYLRIYDIANPSDPVLLGSARVVGTPRDLVVIPRYRYRLNLHEPTRTNDLVAVVGGDLDTVVDDLDSVIVRGQYLRIFEIEDPARPREIASPIISYRAASAVNRVMWQAPLLAYQEFGADLHQVAMVNLQELLIGWHATPGQRDTFPTAGREGVDADSNGDYAGAGDSFPLPQRRPAEFYGRKQSYVIAGTTQRVLDFSLVGGTLGVTLTGGFALTTGGQVDTGQPVFPQYRTVAFNGLDVGAGSVDFAAADYPGRMLLVDGLPVENNGQLFTPIVALVSLSPDREGRHRLVAIDISLPETPKLIADIEIPEDLVGGTLRSVRRREDGLLELTTVSHVFQLDSRLLSRPSPPEGQLHPAIVGYHADAGGRMRSLGTSPQAVHAAAEGGRNQLIQSAPPLAFVNFPLEADVVDPRHLTRNVEELEVILGRAQRAEFIVPARVRNDHLGHVSDLEPAHPELHYHVLVEAPGGAGRTLQLGLESLSPGGWPLPNKGAGFPPVRALDPRTLEALGIQLRAECDAPVRALTAYRLSDDPSSPLFNRYLSRPFVVVYESLSLEELETLRLLADREVLWSGAGLRAFLEPTEQSNPPIGAFAARVDVPHSVIFPVGSAVAKTLDVSYIMGPNPPPPGGDMSLPGTFGTVSAHSGEVRTEAADLALPSPRMPIAIERTIGGQDNYDGPFGLGWDFNYNQRLTELLPQLFPAGFKMPLIARDTLTNSVVGNSKDLLFHTGAGRIVLFEWRGEEMPPEFAEDPLVEELGYGEIVSDYYLPEPGVFDLLVKFKDGKYERLTPGGQRFGYAVNGRLETIRDRFPANRHELDYNARGWLRRIDDRSVSAPRYVEFGYYRRDNDGEFVPQLDERSENPYLIGRIARLRDHANRDVLFFYDDQGLLIRREGIEVGGENGGFSGRNETHYLYRDCRFQGVAIGPNQVPLAAAVTQPGIGGVPVATDINGIAGSTRTEVPEGNVARSLEGLVTSSTKPDNGTTQFTFNAFGSPTSITASGPGVEPATLQLDPNIHGQITRVVYPEGRVHRMTFDSNNPIFRSRGNLLEMAVQAGPRGGESYTETYAYDPRYNLPSGNHTIANGFTIAYSLAADGRSIRTIQYGEAGSEVMTYNDHGQLTEHTNFDGTVTSRVFNSANGFLERSFRGPHATSYSYGGLQQSLGRPTTTTPPRGAPIQTAYNAHLQPVAITRGEGHQRMAYNEQGNRILHSENVGDGKTRETRLTIDELGFVHRRVVDGIEVGGSETALEFVYTPDSSFRVQSILHPGGSLQTFTYDAHGRRIRMELESYVEEYDRDLHGNVLSVKKGGDEVIRMEYDGLDRPKTIITLTGSAEYITEMSYFPGGELRSRKVIDPVFGVVEDQTVNAIDPLGRVLSTTINGDLFDRTDTLVHGTLQRRSVGPRQVVTETWNTAGYPVLHSNAILETTMISDGNGNIERSVRKEDDATFEEVFTYDELDHRRTAADILGPISEFNARADGRNTRITNARGNAMTMEHSALGEPLRRRRADGMEFRFRHNEQRQLVYTGDPSGGFDQTYDELFRLTQSTLRDGSEISNNSFDARNQPTSVTLPGGTLNLTYDLQTRVTTRTVTFGATSYKTSLGYDALNRVREVEYEQNGGSANRARYSFDKAGPLREARFEEDGAVFSVGYEHRDDLTRSRVIYPSGYVVNQQRDASGRLTGIRGTVDDIVSITEWHGAGLPRTVNYGGVLLASHRYDNRGRPTGTRFVRTPGNGFQAELRYQHDAANNVEMRQFLHRSGKTDNFSYDQGERLVRAQMGGIPVEGDAGVSRPRYQRNYNFDGTGLDYLLTAPVTGPDGSTVPFAASWSGHDAFLLPGVVNGVSRSAPDTLGRVSQAQLWMRPESGSQPVPVVAEFQHNGLGQLTRIERADGVVIENFFQPGGLRYARRVTQGGTVLDYRHFLYDDAGRLLEEFDRSGAESTLLARYFYLESDAPLAAELPDEQGVLRRFYYIHDDQSSVVAVADRFGVVQERVWYDPYGQPMIEPRDEVAPVINRVLGGAGGTLLIELSEPVTSIAFDLGPQAGIRRFDPVYTDLVSQPAGLSDLPEQVPGFAASTVIVFTPDQPISGPVDLRLRPGNLTDDWNNHVIEQTVTLDVTGVPGAVYYSRAPIPLTDSGTLAQSQFGSPFLWHGQYFDYDTGLVYLRARFYDPFAGMFLAPDPLGYEDSVNLYAGIGNNPTSKRDPSGLIPKALKKWMWEKVKEHPTVDAMVTEAGYQMSALRVENNLLKVGMVKPVVTVPAILKAASGPVGQFFGGHTTASLPSIAKAGGVFGAISSSLMFGGGADQVLQGEYALGSTDMVAGATSMTIAFVSAKVAMDTAAAAAYSQSLAGVASAAVTEAGIGLTGGVAAGASWMASVPFWVATVPATVSVELSRRSIRASIEGRDTPVDVAWRHYTGQEDVPLYEYKPVLGRSLRQQDLDKEAERERQRQWQLEEYRLRREYMDYNGSGMYY